MMGRSFAPLRAATRAAALCLLIALLAACSRPQIYHQEAYVFGTRVDLSIFGDSQEAATDAMAAVLQEFDRLHHAFHPWKPSEVTRLNEVLARGETAEVSEELAVLLADAKDIAERGDELFDPALGRLIALWGFHDEEFEPELPDPDKLAEILAARPRMAELTIDGTRVSSSNPMVQIDLGGYAKGYALDRAAKILRERGMTNALINIGGNVMAAGHPAPARAASHRDPAAV